MELLSTLSQQAVLGVAQQAPLHKPPEARPAPPADTATQTGTNPRSDSQNGANAALMRKAGGAEHPLSRAEKLDRPAGPPPTFEISLLEQDREMQRSIASMQAQRGLERDADAIAPEPRATSAPREADEAREAQARQSQPVPQDVALADIGRRPAMPLDKS